MSTHPLGLPNMPISDCKVILCADDGSWEIEPDEMLLLKGVPPFEPGHTYQENETALEGVLIGVHDMTPEQADEYEFGIMHPFEFAKYRAYCKSLRDGNRSVH